MPDVFSMNDRVRVVVRAQDGGPPVGTEGTVKHLGANEYWSENPFVLVEFEGWYGGHDDNSRVRGSSSCWNIRVSCLESAVPRVFYLVGIVDKKEVVLSEQPTFVTGKEAAEFAKRLTIELGFKVQPRRFADTNNDEWKNRERIRIEDGIYLKMPDGWDLIPIPDHFLHRSVDAPRMVAYTESPEKGILDRQTRLTPGRYLERFYPDVPERSRKRYIAMVDTPHDVFFAETPEEVEEVYTKGPHSCMAYKANGRDDERGGFHPKLSVHPSRAYAKGDLKLAYLKDGSRITARALVWPDKKFVGRYYGDGARLQQALFDMGYTFGDFIGARVGKIWCEKEQEYVLPYIDGYGMVKDPDPDDPDCFLVISNEGNVSAGNTTGYGTSLRWCPKSKRWSHKPYFKFIHGANEEWNVRACSSWVKKIINKEGASEIWDRNFLILVDGDWKVKSQVEGDLFMSDFSGEWSTKKNMFEMPNGDRISMREKNNCTFICAGNGNRYYEHDMKFIGDKIYSAEYIKAHPEVVKKTYDLYDTFRPTITITDLQIDNTNSDYGSIYTVDPITIIRRTA